MSEKKEDQYVHVVEVGDWIPLGPEDRVYPKDEGWVTLVDLNSETYEVPVVDSFRDEVAACRILSFRERKRILASKTGQRAREVWPRWYRHVRDENTEEKPESFRGKAHLYVVPDSD